MNDSAPTQGDVRLINIRGTNFTTQPCDDVHLGGVEIFNDGRWGRICDGDSGMYNIDAKVICCQLGFPFGSIIDLREVADTPAVGSRPIYNEDYVDYDDPGPLVWATDVRCTGTEDRLDDCFFPQAFGTIMRPGRAVDAPPGIPRTACQRTDSAILAVACRRFEIKGALLLLVALLLMTIGSMPHAHDQKH